ncbi:indolepyruvate ferredoxin oxidoreductase family protein [Novosphingobium beihaiensis]|uniref:Indolepyruvate ferredoxin oxidoreductase family protein n=1 Tax=Novosphingobium beihaiensis TaxID=2930389 RepID=A0ABT0BUE3_9SPHN|nr:indolepyruvate ferredoxin oxidoreductase family protein [Novosphingobium beihaiensis]MCJ2188682.1 indolepyruvate ferredoxin oxidoreductase family protein [Novosphingobium beihaiensis]
MNDLSAMRRKAFGLESIYMAESGPAFMTGIQALVRLPLMQRRMDRKAGLNTAGLVTGYRGSPLGAYDQQLWKAQKYLAAHDVQFQPGLNEDLAATALWGAQMHKAYGETKADGVFGIWYGKGNGVDRTGDVFRNANMLGTSALGGVLAIGGDDHAAQSSMFPHQTDGIFQSVMMPVLQPADVSEILSLGLAGIALSRFSGLWVAMKTIAEVVESAAGFELPDADPRFVSPAELIPAHGLNWDPRINWPAQRAEYERRMIEERLPAAIGWATANRIDRPVFASRKKKLCIVTVGKAHQDLVQALENLGLHDAELQALGVSIYKVAMSWPLATEPLIAFAGEAEEILVVEEKSPTVENQIKTALYNGTGRKPVVTGKTAPDGSQLLPTVLEFSPLMLARVLAGRLKDNEAIDLAPRLAALEQGACSAGAPSFPARKPFFCSGCPHNSSTKTPDGSISGGGIGCHVMALSQPALKTATFSQMGGEGLQWVGAAPFSKTEHIFQNLGDGTYQHSGLLAIRAAVAADTNITFKILYNDAVAMTGGQPAEGQISPALITRQIAAEGVKEIYLVSDDPDKWRGATGLEPGVKIEHRDNMDAVQRHLRTVPGVTAIVYEQTCAAEKRRRRKRKDFPDPDRRLFINPRVCEGCGDCSTQSNCISIEPLDTEFGRKRRINQSACNKDFSCTKGFCPSFVDIEGPVLRKPDAGRIKDIEAELLGNLPLPERAGLDQPYNIFVTGIGGLGVLTVGALLGVAAHLDGQESTVLDFTGLAQKNGAVVSHVRLAPSGTPIHAVRIGAGEADLLLGTDAVVSAGTDTLSRLNAQRSRAIVNSDLAPTADIVSDRDITLPGGQMLKALETATGGATLMLKATRLAEGLFGNNVTANTVMLGYAWQKGFIPLSLEAMHGAIAANGAAVELNLRAFDWGRFAAIDMAQAEKHAGIGAPQPAKELAIDSLIDKLWRDLTEYQDAAYADRYRALMLTAERAAQGLGAKGEAFRRAVAVNAHKLMAYKDEYEVARLYSLPAFHEGLADQFASAGRVSVWLAPPLLSRIDPATGRPAKRKFGPWVFKAFGLLARGKRLRGTPFDPFGRTAERKAERAVRDEYLATIDSLCSNLDGTNLEQATALAALPDMIRGFGPVKEAALHAYAEQRKALTA